MPLLNGSRLGAYEILGLIGTGGMGEVYKARDTRLDRTVALKVLSAHGATDPDRRARFDREARAVAALNHPHICNLHDVCEAASGDALSPPIGFLVMEYLEGQTLEERLVRGPLPPADVLRYAVELADALDHAHRRGLVHRDVKPANVMLTKAGAKLLDFGISRLQAPADLPALSTVTTVGAPLTAAGTVIGTYPYMAPEQLAGREADARSDIFAFGAVLYEMITGRRAFEGATAATLIGAILHTDPPPPSEIRSFAPPALDRVVARCLAKDADDRWQSARDLMLELKWIADHAAPLPVATGRQPRRTRLLVATLAVLAIAAGWLTVTYLRRAPAEPQVVRLLFSPPNGLTTDTIIGGPVTISPDGQRLAFAAIGADGKQQLWVRALDSFEAQALPQTDGGSFPFWSPDSRTLGFFAQGKLKKIQIAGGPPQTLCDARQPRGGTWGRRDVIVFSAGAGYELYQVPAGGGVASAIPADGINQERMQPSFLPDGHHFVYEGRPQKFGVFLSSLDGGTLPLGDYSAAAYAAPGYLLMLKGSSPSSTAMTLLAQPFEPTSLKLTGDPEAVADRIQFVTLLARGGFSVSDNGTLVYQDALLRTAHLAWFDRGGRPLGTVRASAAFNVPALSPDESTIAVMRVDPETQDSDIWLIEKSRGVDVETRFTTYGEINTLPIWSPDGSRLAFASSRRAPPNLYLKASGGGDETLLFPSNLVTHPTDWSRDGRFIVYASQHPRNGWDLMLLPISVAESERKPQPFLTTTFNEYFGRVSPDGRWLAYVSDESGTDEVYVQMFPAAGAKLRLSTSGGTEPKWRGDGKELFYMRSDGTLMAVNVTPGTSFQAGAPMALFKARIPHAYPNQPSYAVTHDGGRFLISTITEESTSVPTKIVFNWRAALNRR